MTRMSKAEQEAFPADGQASVLSEPDQGPLTAPR